ncbi:MAG: hypothetical protein HOQ12_06895 [Gemmatimonadaceae bacterium]|nr:hypothetical protein [Gemmatimonadaceae bacterium]
MPYKKTLICLANSRKESGRCVAGLELNGSALGGWIRPVSKREKEELSIDDRRYDDGSDISVLDIVRITFLRQKPHSCQRENHLIDDSVSWERIGRAKPASLLPAAHQDGTLWINGYSSFNGTNDRIRLTDADKLSTSLTLVAPMTSTFQVLKGLSKRQVRLDFKHAGAPYCLAVTDTKLEAAYLAKPDGRYPLTTQALVCVSIGEEYNGYRYKLAAAVIPLT